MKNKHVLEFFRNDDWRVRPAVLIGQWVFFISILVILMLGGDKLLAGHLLVILLRKLT